MISFQSNDVGNPQRLGRTQATSEGWKLQAGGEDIWGKTDQFHWCSSPVSGDFVLTARMKSLQAIHHYTKAGLMARLGQAADAAHVFLLAFPTDGARNNNSGKIEAQFRPHEGAECTAIYPSEKGKGLPQFPVEFPQVWLRLSRRDKIWTGEVSSDGKSWMSYFEFALVLPSEIEVGLAATSHEGGQIAEVEFDSVTLS